MPPASPRHRQSGGSSGNKQRPRRDGASSPSRRRPGAPRSTHTTPEVDALEVSHKDLAPWGPSAEQKQQRTVESERRGLKGGDKSAVKVMVRIRPFNSRELQGLSANEYPTSILQFQDNTVRLLDKACEQQVDTFQFHQAFWSIPESQKQYGCLKEFATQPHVFDSIGRKAVDTCMSGRHCCVFAYGQTGSGKSYTMLGSVSDPGIAPRIVDDLFARLGAKSTTPGSPKSAFDVSVDVSFMEIYNEKVKDLLDTEGGFNSPFSEKRGGKMGGRKSSLDPTQQASPKSGSPAGVRRRGSVENAPGLQSLGSPGGGSRPAATGTSGFQDLRVRNSPEVGVFVDGLTRLGKAQGIDSAAAVKRIMRRGMEYRATAETQMNATSSRSHAIFQLCLRMYNPMTGKKRYSHCNLVDLAGSERVKMSGVKGEALVEATRINLSLSTLRRVIDILVDNQSKSQGNRQIPPFRESMLTWVLSESLGGNSETMMIATVSPAEENREDTTNTLRYAMKAKKIQNVVRINEQQGNVVMGAMQAEMARLKQMIDTEEQSGDSQKAWQMKEKYAELQATHAQEVEEAAAQREQIERAQAELSEQQELHRRIDDEHRALKEEGVEETHERERVQHEDAACNLRRQESLQRRTEEHATEQRQQAEMEMRAREELNRQKQRTQEAAAESLAQAALLRRQQFSLAFNKAFAKKQKAEQTEKKDLDLGEMQRSLEEIDCDLKSVTARSQELRQENRGLMKAKFATEDQITKDSERRNKELTADRDRMDWFRVAQRQIAANYEQVKRQAAVKQSELRDVRLDYQEEVERHSHELLRIRRAVDASTEERRRTKVELESVRRELARLREEGRECRVSSARLLQGCKAAQAEVGERNPEIPRLRGDTARLQQEMAADNEQTHAALAENVALAARVAELRSIAAEMQRNHDNLRRLVTGRYFAAGELRQSEVASPRAADQSTHVPPMRVWVESGYAMMPSPPRDRFGSPRRSDTCPSPVSKYRNQTPSHPASAVAAAWQQRPQSPSVRAGTPRRFKAAAGTPRTPTGTPSAPRRVSNSRRR